MKLDPEGVEKAAKILVDDFWSDKTPEELFTAAITAYFSHLRESGKAKEAHGWGVDGFMNATTIPGVTKGMKDFPALIIRTEKE